MNLLIKHKTTYRRLLAPRLMKLILLPLMLSLLAFNSTMAQSENNSDAQLTTSPSIQEWVVVLRDPRPARLQGWQSNKYRSSASYNGSLDLKRIGSRFAKKNGLKLKQEWFIESLSVYCLIVEFTQDTQQTLEALQNHKSVEWVQKSNDFKLLTSPNKQADASPTLKKTHPFNTLDYDGQGTVIAMIDSAIDKQHQDLSHAIKSVDDFVITNPQTRQKRNKAETHGTAIAGVLIAQENEKVGISGIAPAAKLLAFRGCWEESPKLTHCNTLSLARALDAVVKQQPDILNLSLSGPYDPLLNRLVDQIIKNKTLVVAAFDPARPNVKRFPSNMPGVLIVRAEKMDAEFETEFTAPGSRIVTTPDDQYAFQTGHSIASAHTSGLLALLTQASEQNPKFQKTINMAVNGKLKSANVLLDQLRTK